MTIDPLNILVKKLVDGLGTIAMDQLSSSEGAVRILKKMGISLKPEDKFDSLYVHSLILSRQEGVPSPVLEIFRQQEVVEAFAGAWTSGKIMPFEETVCWAVESLAPGDRVKELDVDMIHEGNAFYRRFMDLVVSVRTPSRQEENRKLDEIHACVVSAASLSDPETVLGEYLRSVLAENRRIDIKGIYSRSGAGRKAAFFSIEELYTPLKTALPKEIVAEQTDLSGFPKGDSERVHISSLLAENRPMLIIGQPGGGKTTFLRLIACVLAKDLVGETDAGRATHLGLPVKEDPPIPVFIRLAALADVLKEERAGVGCGTSWRAACSAMDKIYGRETSICLQRLLDEGRCAILLDGLDEVAKESVRRRTVDVVHSIADHWRKNRMVLTSRPFGYHDVSSIEGIETVHIDDFGQAEVLEFIDRWVRGLFHDAAGKETTEYLAELQSAIVNVPAIRRLSRNPVMLTCLCVVHWNERKLPEGKADLLAAVLRWLLNAREENREKRGYNNLFAEECFKALALSMTTHPDGKKAEVDISWAAEQLTGPFRDRMEIVDGDRVRREGARFLEEEMLDSGIVEKQGAGRLRFWHLTFQEHYAARSLVDRSDDEWWGLIENQLVNSQWTEVLDHLAGCLAWTGLYRLDLFVGKILGTIIPGDLSSIARAVGVLGRILRILEVYEYQPPPKFKWGQVQKEAMAIFALDGAAKVPADRRIAAAEALGEAGDPRIEGRSPQMLPIPGRPEILLGKYPVTVAEFGRFVENGGYSEPRYWKDGWPYAQKKQWKEPDGWEEQTEHLNRPVVGVSWYEAIAYCNWLSKHTGVPVRLPTEEEWGKAATHDHGEYPWGSAEPTNELINYDGNVGCPTPVGVYPAGAAPGGHLDMAGNVWEWCRDSVGKDGDARVIRGGSWSFVARGCRSAVRFSYEPGFRYDVLGFRLARSVALDP